MQVGVPAVGPVQCSMVHVPPVSDRMAGFTCKSCTLTKFTASMPGQFKNQQHRTKLELRPTVTCSCGTADDLQAAGGTPDDLKAAGGS